MDAFKMYYMMRASATSLHRESTKSLISTQTVCTRTYYMVAVARNLNQPDTSKVRLALDIHQRENA